TAMTCFSCIIISEPSTWTIPNERIMCYPCPRTPVTHVSGPYTAAKKVGAAPHRGNACIPPRKQGKAKKTKKSDQSAPRRS
ncbi:hypothetical protein AB4Y43_40610, partial [Paraburkholderia sp. BR10872]|uniref:hypothetical protein n=1 Tax=Paraburkholderia sp. BR10872 TaxID=3236989 RepID=UPI0034D2DF3C